mmetsp:Transcript_5864/g.8862  ORF Transcript_5864/g.8862 Transcript_5864/m.8862 type:complete len:479 (+) Transcript_5864:2-1438(+)
MKVPFPIRTAIAAIRWPLSTPSMPMYYEPISSLQTLRQPNSIPSVLQPIISRGIAETINDLVIAIEYDIENVEEITLARHYTTLSLALVLLGNGLADEAHDLITPLSWNEDTYFGGPTMVAQADGSVIAVASYAHSLIHRREGFAQGEYAMMGYQNAQYWTNALDTRRNSLSAGGISATATATVLPFEQVRDAIGMISKNFGSEAESWCQQRLNGMNVCCWDPRFLHELSATVSRDENICKEFKEFASAACELELRVLLNYCLGRAGYECDDVLIAESPAQSAFISNPNTKDSTSEKLELDVNLAQTVANKVSSAHIGAFQSSASVTVRSVLRSVHVVDDNNPLRASRSAAAGLACRLLGSPAVKIARNSMDSSNADRDGTALHVILPLTESEGSNAKFGSAFYGGGPFGVGDAFACYDVDETDTDTDTGNEIGVQSFIPCDSSDTNAVFVDRFHGTRGDTPTSVLQWSKGTIHKSVT